MLRKSSTLISFTRNWSTSHERLPLKASTKVLGFKERPDEMEITADVIGKMRLKDFSGIFGHSYVKF
jgi:hypothetical protein